MFMYRQSGFFSLTLRPPSSAIGDDSPEGRLTSGKGPRGNRRLVTDRKGARWRKRRRSLRSRVNETPKWSWTGCRTRWTGGSRPRAVVGGRRRTRRRPADSRVSRWQSCPRRWSPVPWRLSTCNTRPPYVNTGCRRCFSRPPINRYTCHRSACNDNKNNKLQVAIGLLSEKLQKNINNNKCWKLRRR